METITIDILNPKAKALLTDLVNLKLIRIRKDEKQSFSESLKKFRSKSDTVPSLKEITKEVEAVRKSRHEKQEGNN